MSFNTNDNNNNMIHLGNYEEFFVLYMDNELSDEQMKMVDDFLLAHPDLQAEFEIIAATKLPAEEYSFDKTDLFAEKMKFSSVDEDLLLFIDNELPADKAKIVELEIASNKDYQLQHSLLVKAKLDSGEKITYPDKEELYRRTERRIGFKPWMRIAAAAVVIAASGLLYFNNQNTGNSSDDSGLASKDQITLPVKKQDPVKPEITKENLPSDFVQEEKPLVAERKAPVLNKNIEDKNVPTPSEERVQDLIAQHTPDQTEVVEPSRLERAVPVTGEANGHSSSLYVANHKELFNNLPVTPTLEERNTGTTTPTLASSNEKGSVKGFLRKATRLIEKRTGIDATSDGELLIGVVAVKLK